MTLVYLRVLRRLNDQQIKIKKLTYLNEQEHFHFMLVAGHITPKLKLLLAHIHITMDMSLEVRNRRSIAQLTYVACQASHPAYMYRSSSCTCHCFHATIAVVIGGVGHRFFMK
jgi:hypothetical protein